LSGQTPPAGHYATWLPPLAEANAQPDGIERIWITLSEEISRRTEFTYCDQAFIVLPTRREGRASSLYKADRAAIAGVLKEIQPDLVHGWGTEDVYALAAATSGFPFVISMQGILTHYLFHARTDFRTLFQAVLEFFILRKTTALTCESRWAKAIMRHRAPRAKITCVEYGVHRDFYDAAWQPDSNRPAALFVGSLVARKGIQDVLQAFQSPLLKDTELWIVGSGPLDHREGSPPNVKWLGRLNRSQLIAKMSKAWCLVLPTRADTSPNVVKEARVIGLPVVTTPCGGQSDYIRDGQNGFLVAPGDIPTLTDRLHRLLSNEAFCRQCGQDGWEQERDFFRTDHMAEKFRQVYHEIHQSAASGTPLPK
jgi:glycosyltransferase involved in cell wall biosynthesis